MRADREEAGRLRAGQGHRCRIRSQVSFSPHPPPLGKSRSQEGALPRPISGDSREKKELRSRREGRRGGLIRPWAAAAPPPPLGSPHPSPGHLKGSSAH